MPPEARTTAAPADAAGQDAVRIDHLSMRYGRVGEGTLALSDVDLRVREGEFVCLLGRSGCGKSTLLSIVAGLEHQTGGTVDVGGRRVGMMFQDSGLFPWLTVAGNIRLALKLSGVPREAWDARVAELLEIVRLPHVEKKRPHELSGGMRQRVALARTLAQDCQVLLMDEPFAALDAITRDAMHDEIERIWAARGLTVIFVTHNVREAVRLGDRVILMKPAPGRVAREMLVDLPRPRKMDDTEIATRAAELHDELDLQERLSRDGDEEAAA